MSARRNRLSERPTVPLKRRPSMVLVGYTPDGRPLLRPFTPEAERLFFDGGMTDQAADGPRHARPEHPVAAPRRTVPHYVWISGLLMLAGVLTFIGWALYTMALMLLALLPLILGVGAFVLFVFARVSRGGVTITQNVNL